MLMLHGLGLDRLSAEPEPLPPPASLLTRLTSGLVAKQVVQQPPSTTGCPAGYVQGKLGCMALEIPGSSCPPGSIQTGSGCLPSEPAPMPAPPPPQVYPIAPIPMPPPQVFVPKQYSFEDRWLACQQAPGTAACINWMAEVNMGREQCKSDPLSPACIDLFASLQRVGALSPQPAPPPAQEVPISATQVTMTPTEPPPMMPYVEKRNPVKLGLMIAGGVGVAALIGLAAFRR